MKAKALSILFAALMAVPALPVSASVIDLDTTPKSLYFAGRCMAPVMLREAVSTKDLRQMPVSAAVPHLFGEDGEVWFGPDESLVLVKLSGGAHCGINVFDEDIAEVEDFMAYWLIRDESPFAFTERREDAASVRLFYDGFCESCGFNVHARALWLKDSNFTIYRVFATTPEKSE